MFILYQRTSSSGGMGTYIQVMIMEQILVAGPTVFHDIHRS